MVTEMDNSAADKQASLDLAELKANVEHAVRVAHEEGIGKLTETDKSNLKLAADDPRFQGYTFERDIHAVLNDIEHQKQTDIANQRAALNAGDYANAQFGPDVGIAHEAYNKAAEKAEKEMSDGVVTGLKIVAGLAGMESVLDAKGNSIPAGVALFKKGGTGDNADNADNATGTSQGIFDNVEIVGARAAANGDKEILDRLSKTGEIRVEIDGHKDVVVTNGSGAPEISHDGKTLAVTQQTDTTVGPAEDLKASKDLAVNKGQQALLDKLGWAFVTESDKKYVRELVETRLESDPKHDAVSFVESLKEPAFVEGLRKDLVAKHPDIAVTHPELAQEPSLAAPAVSTAMGNSSFAAMLAGKSFNFGGAKLDAEHSTPTGNFAPLADNVQAPSIASAPAAVVQAAAQRKAAMEQQGGLALKKP